MLELATSLVDLTALRDRDQLDLQSVAIVKRLSGDACCSIRLSCRVDDGGEGRWLTFCHIDKGQHQAERDVVTLDVGDMPLASSQPLWQRACAEGQVVRSHNGHCVTVFPVGTDTPCVAVLELETQLALTEQAEALVVQVLRAYQNMLGLLDYGEKDTLTELLNRKTFDNAFLKIAMVQGEQERKVDHERRSPLLASNFWLAVLDIDHFKRVNDNYGHLIGDEVLLLMARLMRKSFRIQDKLYRFGGEEFVVLMRAPTENDAASVLERFRRQIEAHEFPQVGRITVSIGFSMVRGMDLPSDAFDRADQAVYHAKGNGRNQVCHFEALVRDGIIAEAAAPAEDVDFF